MPSNLAYFWTGAFVGFLIGVIVGGSAFAGFVVWRWSKD